MKFSAIALAGVMGVFVAGCASRPPVPKETKVDLYEFCQKAKNLRIGMTQDQVIREIGEPYTADISRGSFQYRTYSPLREKVINVEFRDGKMSHFGYSCDIDELKVEYPELRAR